MEQPKLRVFAWNPKGIRSLLAHPECIVDFLRNERPDILFFPETKANKAQHTKVQADLNSVFETALPGQKWMWHWSYCAKAGLHGNAVAIRSEFAVEWIHTNLESVSEPEGRVISVKLVGKPMVFIGLYVPNASTKLVRLDYKLAWLRKLRTLFDSYRSEGLSVVAIGDINVAPDERDLCNPTSNLKTPGYSPQERETFAKCILSGYADVWREQHVIPKKTQKQQGSFTFWTQRNGDTARANNSGWRLDLILVDKETWEQIKDTSQAIHGTQYIGSDHCPIGFEILY